MDQSNKKLAQMSGVFGKDDVKLEWMYKGPTDLLNREEYLLGRAIDKNFEELDAAEKTEKLTKLIGVTNPKNHVEHECVPLSIRAYKTIETSEQVDLQRKLLEDPLFAIKQKEIESRKRILENPVKLKQLSKILKKDETLKKHKKKSKNKKKKKKHKKSSSSDESNDSDDDLDKALIKKLKKLDKDSKSSKLDMELKALLNNNKKLENKKNRRSSQSSCDSDSDDKYRRRKNENRHNERYDERKRERYDERKHERNKQFNKRRHSGDYSSNSRKRYDDDSSRSSRYERPSSSSISTKTSNSTNNQRKNKDDKQKITEEERNKKLREMMENANWREQDRSREVKKYRDECKNEEKQVSNFDHNFINKEMRKAISNQNSVESRIKSNINNIQRNTHSMNRNFAKR